MASETTFGREPVQIVELDQPRCALRFGTAPCTATGTPKCYNTYWTCLDRENYDPTGRIVWRFSKPDAGIWPLYERDGETIRTNPIPCLLDVSTAPSRVNLAATRKSESPFGVRASVEVTLSDPQWDDHVGDFYLADRTPPAERPSFWSLWQARNPFYPGALIRVYEGYRGQALSEMQQRLYVLDRADPPTNGRVTLRGSDPLQLSDKDRAMFPRATDIRLAGAIDAATTTIAVITPLANLTDTFGNSAHKYARIGSEIIRYDGQTGTAPDYTLTGVVRGALNTVAAAHQADAAVQRVGRYENLTYWRVAHDLLTAHTPMPAQFIDLDQWDDEGNRWLNTFRTTATVVEPTPVEVLAGELMRDGLFFIWWDERAQTIPMQAVRPPEGIPPRMDDRQNIISAEYTSRPDDRLTRVTIYYGQFDPTKRLDDFTNYDFRRIRIDAEAETEAATGGEIRELEIFSRWIRTQSQAFLLAAQILLRYRLIPRYLRVTLDAKDRAITIGDVRDVATRTILDTQGNPTTSRWQVISFEEMKPGETCVVDMQSYTFIGKFALIMPNDAPDYEDATEDERLSGCWLADDATGLMPDGTDPYLLQ